MRAIYSSGALLLQIASVLCLESGATKLHEQGRCSIRGQCGKTDFFGSELPCPDNGKARVPKQDVREEIVKICGAKWNEGAVCCEEDQVGSPSLAMRILLTEDSSRLYAPISKEPIRLLAAAQHVKRIFTTSFVHLPARQISRYS